jgi:hypothetical protein
MAKTLMAPVEIYQAIQEDFKGNSDIPYLPELRTVQRVVQEEREAAASEDWTLDHSTGQDTANILNVWRAFIYQARGRAPRRFRVDEAYRIARLLRAVPDLPAEIVWVVALARQFEQDPNFPYVREAIMDYLAISPWRSQWSYGIYTLLEETGQIPRVPFRRILVEPFDPAISDLGRLEIVNKHMQELLGYREPQQEEGDDDERQHS